MRRQTKHKRMSTRPHLDRFRRRMASDNFALAYNLRRSFPGRGFRIEGTVDNGAFLIVSADGRLPVRRVQRAAERWFDGVLDNEVTWGEPHPV